MKANTVYKRAYNRCLDLLGECPLGKWDISEPQLAEQLDVSRTTARAVLLQLDGQGIVQGGRGTRRLHRLPSPTDYFPDTQTETVAQVVARKFMQWVLEGDVQPGQTISVLDLARQFGVSTTALREYLTHFGRFGLIKRRENSGWTFVGVTQDFAKELYEIREMFELRSALLFVTLGDTHPAWAALGVIEREHHELLRNLDHSFAAFSQLDERLHRLIQDSSRNRFIRDFYDVISFVFHYHYQWNKVDEQERNFAALQEHLIYIAALRSRDPSAVKKACLTHLLNTRAAFLRSIPR